MIRWGDEKILTDTDAAAVADADADFVVDVDVDADTSADDADAEDAVDADADIDADNDVVIDVVIDVDILTPTSSTRSCTLRSVQSSLGRSFLSFYLRYKDIKAKMKAKMVSWQRKMGRAQWLCFGCIFECDDDGNYDGDNYDDDVDEKRQQWWTLK